MSKKELLRQSWIHIAKRQPPVDSGEIWVWHPLMKRSFVWDGPTAFRTIEKLVAGEIEDVSPDRRISHWLPVFPPMGKYE
jgi:hypothetical protein